MKRLLCCITALLCLWSCESDPLPGNGQWRIINYWAIWCAPCREEIPELNELDRSTELIVLAVNYDGKTGEELASQAAEMGISFALLEEDPRVTLNVARPKVLPTTLLVSPDGHVTDTLVGPQTREGLLALWQTRR